ncbi:MAG TPA: hypothetical protein VMG41_04955 [Gemmatimonadales bacterium]|nr:hypothetical protein [Gemmatimonadales bacterium]
MREWVVRLLRWGVAMVILAFVVRTFQRNWHDLRSTPISWTFRPIPALASVLVVLAMYIVLIEAWRRVLAGWGERLEPLVAARIWVLSSLGKYVPGKVWAIAGMAIMAKDAGVAPWAATASAIMLQALAIGTGAALGGGLGAAALEAQRPGMVWMLGALGVVSAAGVGAMLYPPITRRVLALARIGTETPSPDSGAVLLGLAANVLAWIGYGCSLWLLARAVLPTGDLPLTVAIAGFSASYVAGLVALLVPGGLLVREGLLVIMLQGGLGLGAATALALASRALLTTTELGAAVPFLLFRGGNPRVV